MRAFVVALASIVVITTLLFAGGRAWLVPGETAYVGDPMAGERIFNGRGRCQSCHGSAGRCPDLAGLKDRAGQRQPGLSAIAYVVQSLYEPDAHVVAGYPRGLMPAAHLPPVALTDEDLAALVIYLLYPGQETARPAVVAEVLAAQVPFAGRTRPSHGASGDAKRGSELFVRLGCRSCHDGDPMSRLGPSLGGVGATQPRAFLEQSIWEPDAVVDPGRDGQWQAPDGSSRMPSYQAYLDRAALLDLVAYVHELPADGDAR